MSGDPGAPTGSHPAGDPDATRRRRRRGWVAVGGVVAGVALVAALLGFGLSRDPSQLRSPLVAKAAPDFSLPTLDGGDMVRLSDLRGQVVVLNFWASWCAECRVEHPALQAAWDRFRDQGVVFLGVPFQDAPSASKRYAAAMGGDWPLLSDPSSSTALAFGVYGVPETFFIDARGRVVAKRVGPVSYDQLIDEVSRLVEQRSA